MEMIVYYLRFIFHRVGEAYKVLVSVSSGYIGSESVKLTGLYLIVGIFC